MNRRHFLKSSTLFGAAGIALPKLAGAPLTTEAKPAAGTATKKATGAKGELLYNGIQLPAEWPPRNIDPDAFSPMPVPYLVTPPKIIPIEVGRQLFVDDFLIQESSLKRVFHLAKKKVTNPILKPETALERGGKDYLPSACPKDGGVWWDPQAKIFKMWYEAGWLENMAYATSRDGLNWERPVLSIVPGTNRIVPGLYSASDTVVLDNYTTNPAERYKMFLRQEVGKYFVERRVYPEEAFCLVSADGVNWSKPLPTGYCGDRSTIFYNPFRKKWVFSLRSSNRADTRLPSRHGRARYYREHSDFLAGAKWEDSDLVFWTGADFRDPFDPEIGEKPQLYNVAAVAYESLILGIHEVHLGPSNDICMDKGIPKITDITLSYSRDGFHWDRPDRRAFIPSTRTPGSWDRGYVQSVGGVFTIMGDELWFYYSGFAGDEQRTTRQVKFSGTYAHGATGIATLRRDGFASLRASSEGGSITTRPVTFRGSRLFVNVDCPKGVLKIEVLNTDLSPISGFTLADCVPVSANGTLLEVKWKDGKNLASLNGKPVRFRFQMTNGDLYAFWVSPDEHGASLGYVAAGGPGYNSSLDDVGRRALTKP